MKISLLACAAVVALAGCGGADPITVDAAAAVAASGDYFLQTVDGKALPFVYQEGPADKSETLQNELFIEKTLTFTSTQVNRITQSGTSKTISALATGYVSVSGTTLTFKSSDGSTSTGTLNGNWLTHNTGTHTMMYWKISLCNVATGSFGPC
ncbi:MAG: hypothetical protein V4550_06890 [Gemmatimonadota bacterium]